MLKGALTLPNGISLTDAIVRIENISDSDSNEITTIPKPVRGSTGKEYLSLEYQAVNGGRYVTFRAQVYANQEMLKVNRPVCYIEQEDGNTSFRLYPDSSVAGMDLLQLAEDSLKQMHTGLSDF